MKKSVSLSIIACCIIVLLCLGMTEVIVIKGRVLADSVPISFAHVRVQAQDEYDLTNYNGEFDFPMQEDFDSLVITAWAQGYFNGMSTIFPDDTSVIISLHKLYEEDNPDYQWLSPLKDTLSPNNCGNCHVDVLMDQWSNNAHSNSAKNPFFLSMYYGLDTSLSRDCGVGYKTDFPGTKGNCATCHIPGSAVHDPWGIDPLSVDEISQQGVFCDVCHKIQNVNITDGQGTTGVLSIDFLRPPDGKQIFFGPYEDIHEPDAYLPLIKKSEFCAACHTGKFWGTEVYNSFNEWKSSPYPAMGIECQTCHMYPDSITTHFVLPEKGGLERNPLSIPSHLQPGSRDPQILSNSLSMNLFTEQRSDSLEVMVTLYNDKTGHHVPTDRPSRNMILLIEAITDGGDTLEFVGGETVPWWGGEGKISNGFYSGQPGKGFAKILQDFEGNAPSPSWRPTQILFDNRIAAFDTDTSIYYFKTPDKSSNVKISTKLIYRRFFKETMESKGFEIKDIVMEFDTISIQTSTISSMTPIQKVQEHSIIAYPNPFHNQTSLHFQDSMDEIETINIYDASGRIIQRISVTQQMLESSQVLIDFSGHKSGVYFLSVHSKYCIQTIKLVKN